MAGQEDLPESIIAGVFNGIRNTVAPERLGLEDLEAAVNVDIDNSGQVRRRRGYDQKNTSAHHSLFEGRSQTFVVRDGMLGPLAADYNHTPLVSVGNDPLDYTEVGDTLYFASLTASGKIAAGAVAPWGEIGGGGVWQSPVIAPTDTMGAISGRFLSRPPTAQHIEAHNGRIYLADDKLIWITELYLYDKIDRTRGFIPVEASTTALFSLEAGLFVGTTQGLYMLSGTQARGMKLSMITPDAVVRGSAVRVPAEHMRLGEQKPSGEAVVFLTSGGICAALDSGEVINVTRGKVEFPEAHLAAAMFREQDGIPQYVVAADSGGGPSTEKARIGDYVDAEIIRAADRLG